MKILTQYKRPFGNLGFGRVGLATQAEDALGQLCDDKGVPIIRYWFDPREKFSRNHLSMRDRASGVRHPAAIRTGTFPGAWSHSTEINGTQTLTTSGVFFGPISFNEPAYTFLTTIRARPMLSGSNMLMLSPVGGGAYGPSLGMTSGGRLTVYNGPNVTSRLSEAGVDSFNTNLIAGTSFSTTRGIALLKNGTTVAADSSDKNAPDTTSLRFLGGTLTSSGQYEGAVGISMLVAADLTDPAWARARELIWEYLSAQSGIALA